MDKKYVVAFDLGTSSMKVVIIDNEAKIVASKKKAITPTYPQIGWIESDPVKWWDAACELTKDLVAESGIDVDAVCAVGVGAPAEGIIPMSKEKGKLYDCLTWLDFRCAGVAEEWNQREEEETGVRGEWTGKDMLPKLYWIKRYMPEIWEEMDCFLPDGAYLTYRATGNMVATIQHMNEYTADLETYEYDAEYLAKYDLEVEKFPPVISATDLSGYLTEKAAEELGLKPGIPVSAGVTDLDGAEIGSDCFEKGDSCMYMGTSMLYTEIIDDTPELSKAALFFPAAAPNKNILLVTNDFCGGSIDWIVDRLFNTGDGEMDMGACYKKIDQLLDESKPGADDLFFTTSLNGDKHPIWDTTFRAGFWNLNTDHGRAEMVRAVYEGVAQQINWSMDVYYDYYGKEKPATMRVSGGCCNSERLLQIIADVTGQTIQVINDPAFAVVKGNAFLAFVAAGVLTFDEIKGYTGIERTYEPNPENKEVYDRQGKWYRKFYEHNKDFFAELNG